jgi:hypothetical protein
MKHVDFLAKVKEEVAKLKSVLTAEQTAKLDYSKFDPHVSELCLLGQIFGRYDNEDSVKALPKDIWVGVQNFNIMEMLMLNRQTRWAFERFDFSETKEDNKATATKMTYLEVFLTCRTNSEDVFKYLKGEIEAFEPSFNEVAEEVEAV